MLPPNIDLLRTSLQRISDRSSEQEDMLKELEAVSRALDEAGPLIEQDLRRFTKQAYGVWGGAPGRCPICGQ